ncbi:MAG: DNA-processing protein DprA [Polyangiaceae bacterium]
MGLVKPAPPIVLLGAQLPSRLSDLSKPPKALFIRGELPRGPSVAIVGTRAPTPEASEFARGLAADFARAGVAVLSGGAKGIDTAAHLGALEAGGTTVVIAPAGYAVPYPEGNAGLFKQVVERGGAYVSLVEDDVAATQAAFFPRNAVLVALASAVVVVQAGLRSGAANAASSARRLGRPLFVVPSAPWIAPGLGCIVELRRGARPCGGARDVLELLAEMGAQPIPLEPELPKPRKRRRAPTCVSGPDDLARVRAALEQGATHPDEVADLAGLSVAVVNQLLLTMRLQGVLVSAAPGQLLLHKSSD